ncbi:MAG TPA: hypothetical protein VK489_03800 [Ferruginibacter sp.]|nr:hypothetical protein [Ferruginibacter sp.]
MNIVERIQAPTPKFFIKLRNISLVFATLGASILAAPVALPAIVLKIASYIAVAGGVGTAVSQTATTADSEPVNNNGYGSPGSKW